MTTSSVRNPPNALLRWALRIPIYLYRLRLGWLLGSRFVLLNHIGRKSGQVRQTVVEVVKHDAASNTYYIVSGWGYNSQWYQNLLATPAITVQVGQRKVKVLAETLSPDAGAQVLLDYGRNHALAARGLARFLGIDIHKNSPQQIAEIVRQSLPVVALRPQP